MKMKKIVITLSLPIFIVICCALGSGITGKWTGSLVTPNGSVPISYVLNADSGKITGTLIGPDGELPITNSKLNGNDFGFDTNAGEKVVSNTGRYYPVGDSIAMDINLPGFKLHSTLKRDK